MCNFCNWPNHAFQKMNEKRTDSPETSHIGWIGYDSQARAATFDFSKDDWEFDV